MAGCCSALCEPDRNRWAVTQGSFTVTRLRTLLILFLALTAGCTNVATDAVRTIYPAPAASLDKDTLFSVASDFFAELGYQCAVERDDRVLRCARELRDLYIQQTRAEVLVFPDDESLTHSLFTNRWDTGLIPGELISSEFTNPDVQAFCEYLQAEALGECRLQEASA